MVVVVFLLGFCHVVGVPKAIRVLSYFPIDFLFCVGILKRPVVFIVFLCLPALHLESNSGKRVCAFWTVCFFKRRGGRAYVTQNVAKSPQKVMFKNV